MAGIETAMPLWPLAWPSLPVAMVRAMEMKRVGMALQDHEGCTGSQLGMVPSA